MVCSRRIDGLTPDSYLSHSQKNLQTGDGIPSRITHLESEGGKLKPPKTF